MGAWQSLTERQLENSVGEGAERLRSSIEGDPEGRQRGDVLRAMRALREKVATHSSDHFDAGFGNGAKQPCSALINDPHGQEQNGETTSRDRTPFLPSRAQEHDNAGFATAESPLGMLDVQYKIRAQPGRVRRAPGGPGELRGCGREHCSYRGERDPVPTNAQGQLKCVDQKSYLQVTCKTGQRPEGQMATLELLPRHRAELGEQVTESLGIPDEERDRAGGGSRSGQGNSISLRSNDSC